jgi:PKD repeat protein
MRLRLFILVALCAAFTSAPGTPAAHAVTSQPPIPVFPPAGEAPPAAEAIVDSRGANMSCGSWYQQGAYGGTWETDSTWWEYRCLEPGQHIPEDPGPTDYYYWNGSQSVLYGQWDWANYGLWSWCSTWWDAATDRWYDPWGCWDEPPTASFAYSCSGLSCDFDGGASSDADGTIGAYDWSFDDGTLGTGVTVQHTFAYAGTYEVSLTVTDDVGWQGATWTPVTVTVPNVAPTGTFTPACTGSLCSFDGSGSSDADGTIVSHVWDFGDGTAGSGAIVQHAYAQPGSYTVTLTVTDDDGATGSVSKGVVVTANAPPVAALANVCTGLSCTFDGSASSDGDGTVVGYQWSFGDGTTGIGVAAQHIYSQPGTYTVTLTVTDDDGAIDSDSKPVSLIKLNATGNKVKGLQTAGLTWTGSSAAGFDVLRNGATIATVQANAYTDNIGKKGPGSYVYRVCAVATSVCSNEATVSF